METCLADPPPPAPKSALLVCKTSNLAAYEKARQPIIMGPIPVGAVRFGWDRPAAASS
jgi:hypothetical protein